MSTAIDPRVPIPTTHIRIELPQPLYEEYEKQAVESKREIEEVIVQRLRETISQNTFAGRPIVIAPEQRQRLETAFGRSFSDNNDLVHYLLSIFQLKVGHLSIPLSPELLRRLETRSKLLGFDKYTTEAVIKGLEHHVGLR